MKKLICLLLITLSLTGVLCGCSAQDGKKTTNATQQTATSREIDWYDFVQYEQRGRIRNIQQTEYGTDCDTYSFTYVSDKYNVKAFISIPKTCLEEETPYNCIVYNRGGNSNMGWLTGEEVAGICDATGRVVVASQYRGADKSEGIDEFGGADLQDVISLLDLCEQEFRFIDITNLCMVGVSRGGMMSYMAARADDRVKGIVAVSAVTDLAAAYNEREDMKSILESAIGGSPEELPEEYEKRSAIKWTEEINVPVYIIHNKHDEMVSFSQAEAMNEALADSKYGCSLTAHNDSVHGLHSEDVNYIVEWIDQALPKTK